MYIKSKDSSAPAASQNDTLRMMTQSLQQASALIFDANNKILYLSFFNISLLQLDAPHLFDKNTQTFDAVLTADFTIFNLPLKKILIKWIFLNKVLYPQDQYANDSAKGVQMGSQDKETRQLQEEQIAAQIEKRTALMTSQKKTEAEISKDPQLKKLRGDLRRTKAALASINKRVKTIADARQQKIANEEKRAAERTTKKKNKPEEAPAAEKKKKKEKKAVTSG